MESLDGLAARWKDLRAPFDAKEVGKLPKPMKKDAEKGKCLPRSRGGNAPDNQDFHCGGYHGLPAVHLDYVGHAAVTDRLLRVDPTWTWEPVSFDAAGQPALVRGQGGAAVGLWIRLTVLGVTRLGYGSVAPNSFDAEKQLIGDALRNGAMRFGVGLDLWSKEELSGSQDHSPVEGEWVTNVNAAIAQAEQQDVPSPGEMAGELRAYLKATGWTKDQVLALLSGYGVESINALAGDEIVSILAELRAGNISQGPPHAPPESAVQETEPASSEAPGVPGDPSTPSPTAPPQASIEGECDIDPSSRTVLVPSASTPGLVYTMPWNVTSRGVVVVQHEEGGECEAKTHGAKCSHVPRAEQALRDAGIADIVLGRLRLVERQAEAG